MIEAFCGFSLAFLFLGILGAALMAYFTNLSDKRRAGSITEEEKWIQTAISLPALPVLETILSKDPIGIRVIITACVIFAALIAAILTNAVLPVSLVTLFLLAAVWLTAPFSFQ